MLVDSKACAKVLLDRGADPTIENDTGHRPIDYAKEGEVKEMLTEYAIKYDELLKDKVCTVACFPMSVHDMRAKCDYLKKRKSNHT